MACSNRRCSSCGCGHKRCAQVNYPDTGTCSSSSCGGCSSCSHGCHHGCGYPPFRPPIGVPWSRVNANANFGLLRTVQDSAAARRYWADVAAQQQWQDYPFYGGPCGPCAADCECNHHCGGCHKPCCDHGFPPIPPLPPLPEPDAPCPANATFIAGSPLSLAAGDNVTLSSITTNTDGFIPTTGGIRILNAGTYMVVYTIQIPVGEAVSTRFQLSLDGGNIPSSAVDVTTSSGDEETSSYTMHALIQAGENSLLNLNTLNAITLTTTGAASAVTLSIMQIC